MDALLRNLLAAAFLMVTPLAEPCAGAAKGSAPAGQQLDLQVATYLTSEYCLTFYTAGPGPHKVSIKGARREVRILSQQNFPAS